MFIWLLSPHRSLISAILFLDADIFSFYRLATACFIPSLEAAVVTPRAHQPAADIADVLLRAAESGPKSPAGHDTLKPGPKA